MVMRNHACFLFAVVFQSLAQRLLQRLAFLGERQRVRMHALHMLFDGLGEHGRRFTDEQCTQRAVNTGK